MSELIKTELMKMKRSNVWLSMILIPMTSVLLGGGNYYLNREALQSQWYSLWTQASLFYGFFFYAVTIAITASYSWRMEHQDNNWNRILALPYRHSQIIVSKIISISMVSLCIQLTFVVFYYVAGKFIFQFQTGFPIEVFIWTSVSWISSIAICAMQSFVSMKLKSFSIPVGIALFFCFVGFAFYVYKGFGENLVYFSPNSLLITSMSSNKTEILGWIDYIKVLLSSIGFTVFFTFLSTSSMKKMRV